MQSAKYQWGSCHESAVRARMWTERVWAEAEAKWLARDGQDSFYTDYVVVPGLVRGIQQLCTHGLVELVDIGCGDGYCTEHLVASMIRAGFSPSRIFLLDRSRTQLEIASDCARLNEAVSVRCDLNDYNWFTCLPPRDCQRILVSVFTVQELPALVPLVAGLGSLMSADDTALLLTVAPMYSASLLRRGQILEPISGSIHDDWRWRGLYPIDNAAGTAYLPHFQRTVDQYRRALCRHGLRCISTHYLVVPPGGAANSVFSNTVYGRQIIGVHSSVILAVRKGDAGIVKGCMNRIDRLDETNSLERWNQKA
jgi:hypothetical protein